MSDLEYSVTDSIATILLNRPEKKNAFTDEMLLSRNSKLPSHIV